VPTPEEAEEILKSLGLPKGQQNERSALTLLALANLDPNAAWTATEPVLLRTVDIMEFMRTRYGKDYKPNSRETIRPRPFTSLSKPVLLTETPTTQPDQPIAGTRFIASRMKQPQYYAPWERPTLTKWSLVSSSDLVLYKRPTSAGEMKTKSL
jgi:hypothetical protein